ncbi:MAG: metallopeptidase family protein [Zavarzinella sp.]|nr:metallopeptidase family protein [Zavarzinella sp.]
MGRNPSRSHPMPHLSDKEFRDIVRRTMETLPAEFQQYLDNVVVEVADWPDDDLLRRAGFTEEEIEDGEMLLGFYEQLPMPSDGIFTIERPDKLWIFREPHIEEFPDPRRLRTEVRKTVIHELGHHFGFDERDLERFDDNPDPFGNEE